MKKIRSVLRWILKFVLLLVLFCAIFITGTMVMTEIPVGAVSEPGPFSETAGLLIYAVTHVTVILLLILTSRWKGLKLSAALSFAYYGAVTLLTQIETWYFLSSLTVSEELLIQLFMMGIPVAFVFIPLAVWIVGDTRLTSNGRKKFMQSIPLKQWIWKLMGIAVIYVILYWLAGYFIAWQNPELRAFYGSPGEITPFIEHTMNTFENDSGLFAFQILRGLLWTLCAVPIIRGSGVDAWWTALLVGLFLSAPQNIGHLLSNPLIPDASVRMSHMIETATSTFLFGLIIVWFLHRRHQSLRDLL
ncbi:MAG: hypothetical protein GVY07_07865 [Bacteroidetes bacterium]|jgi:hypothetical protein|nr:hypothetical protein [Bacteroidota bacterium]